MITHHMNTQYMLSVMQLGLIIFSQDTKETEYYMNKHHMFSQVRVEFESLSQKLKEKLNKFTNFMRLS